VTDTETTDVAREQLETAMLFLEESHGDALRRPWSDEAHAYYNAIEILDAAMNEELRTPEERVVLDHQKEYLERSREAREEGYAAATCLNTSRGESRVRAVKNDDQPETLAEKFIQIFR